MFNSLAKFKKVGEMFLVCLAFAPAIYLEIHGVPAKGEFLCSDASIQHTFKGETYPCWSLLVIGLPVPVLIILFTETLTKGSRYRTLTTYLFGLFTSISLVNIIKYTVGRPRPIFMEWCQPILSDQIDCVNSTNHNRFVTDYLCENARNHIFQATQSTLSFPSGHASISVYALTYLALYLHYRISSKKSLLLKHFLQAVCICLAASVSVSRVTDHMHFWSDVAVGIVIGASFACWIVFSMSDLAKPKDGKGNLSDEVSSEV